MLTKEEERIIKCFKQDPKRVIDVFQFILAKRKASSEQETVPPERKNATIQ